LPIHISVADPYLLTVVSRARLSESVVAELQINDPECDTTGAVPHVGVSDGDRKEIHRVTFELDGHPCAGQTVDALL